MGSTVRGSSSYVQRCQNLPQAHYKLDESSIRQLVTAFGYTLIGFLSLSKLCYIQATGNASKTNAQLVVFNTERARAGIDEATSIPEPNMEQHVPALLRTKLVPYVEKSQTFPVLSKSQCSKLENKYQTEVLVCRMGGSVELLLEARSLSHCGGQNGAFVAGTIIDLETPFRCFGRYHWLCHPSRRLSISPKSRTDHRSATASSAIFGV